MEIIRGKEGRAANKAVSEENLRRIRIVKEQLFIKRKEKIKKRRFRAAKKAASQGFYKIEREAL